jgi:pimeloyl-ACP methyl ester carboxylesterase
LPPAEAQGYVEHVGARIWYAAYGSGVPVMLLHGALGCAEDWVNQVPALTGAGFRVILIDSRGHGRSTRDARPFSYELMASDVLAVMDALNLERAAIAGWSDGAIVGLVLALKAPARVTRVFAFAGNMDLGGVKPVPSSDPVVAWVLERAAQAYARLSETPAEFRGLYVAVTHMMKTQPNYSAGDLAGIRVPVAIATGDRDEFIKLEHIEYLARSIPGAKLIVLPGATHFAPLQIPQWFNEQLLAYLSASF